MYWFIQDNFDMVVNYFIRDNFDWVVKLFDCVFIRMWNYLIVKLFALPDFDLKNECVGLQPAMTYKMSMHGQ